MADKHKERTKRELRRRRHVRKHTRGTAERPRLTVSKSLRNVVAQLIDDQKGATLLSATTATALAAGEKKTKTEAAKQVGQALAEMAKERGIKAVVFDRNQYVYHGRIRAVAEGAREGGLEF
jgi:large subunit ribosomal protein L18